MSRSRLVATASAIVAGVGLALVAAWFFLLRDTAEPVSVEEVVTSFRTETEPTPTAPSPIPEGVYVYATQGFEKTDALTGVTHRYPKRSTITITGAECGASLHWRVLKGRSTEWIYCVKGPEVWEFRSQDERHTFFGRTETTTYVCQNTPIRRRGGDGGNRRVSCSTGSAEEEGVIATLGSERLSVGGKQVVTEHVRKTTRFTGAIRGTARHDIWFARETGVPVRIVMVSRTTNDSAVGDVHYVEDVALRLASLVPRR